MSSTRSKLNRPKRRRETTYRRGYEDGKLAALSAAEPQPAPSVAVKALEWREDWGGSDDDIVKWVADTPWGRVSASVAGYRNDEGKSYERHADVPDDLRDRLQAAAQANYETRIRSALSPQVQDAPEKVGRFGHHHEPAIDFCIEVEALEGHLFDAKHSIGKPGHEPRRIDDEFRRRVSSAMDFIVGGDQIAIAAKATLRSISAQVQDAPVKSFIVDYVFDGEPETKTFAYDSEQQEAEAFCTEVKAKGGAVNIRIGDVPAAPAKQEGGADGR